MSKVDGSVWSSPWIQSIQLPSTSDMLLHSSMDFQSMNQGVSVLMSFREIENLIPLNKAADKTRMFWTLLKGQAMSYFEDHLRRILEAEDSELPSSDLIALVIGKLYIVLK
jgi:hypothetical protein